MELSTLLYLLCSSKASKIDFLELGFRNWGCALLLYIENRLEMSLYSCLSGRSIRRIALGYTAYRSWLGVGTTFSILIPSRIFVWDLVYGVSCGSIRRIGVNLQDTAYMMGSYAVLVFTCPDGSSRCLIRRILQGYTAYRSWQRPECVIFIDLVR